MDSGLSTLRPLFCFRLLCSSHWNCFENLRDSPMSARPLPFIAPGAAMLYSRPGRVDENECRDTAPPG